MGEEIIRLDASGTFSQQITVNGRVFESEGEWTVENPRTIIFRGKFLARKDMLTSEALDPPKAYSYYKGFWYSKPDRVVFDNVGNTSSKEFRPKVKLTHFAPIEPLTDSDEVMVFEIRDRTRQTVRLKRITNRE